MQIRNLVICTSLLQFCSMLQHCMKQLFRNTNGQLFAVCLVVSSEAVVSVKVVDFHFRVDLESCTFTANSKPEISQNGKSADKISSKHFLWIKLT